MSHSVSRPLPLADTPEIVLMTPDEPHELEAARAIFRDYAASLGIDLGFQNFDEELANLPGDYAEPRGALLLALVNVSDTAVPVDAQPLQRAQGGLAYVAGCCALRPLDTADYPNAAEMKRLYVRPAFRGRHLGYDLANAIVGVAHDLGYGAMVLDTLASMEPANALYKSMGFRRADAYYENPLPNVRYFVLDLTGLH